MHLPWWFPGASFKKEAERLAPHIDDMVNKPYQTVKDALVRARLCPFHGHLPYRAAREPLSQEQALDRRKIMRKARSSKNRPLLLADLERRYR